MEKQWKLANFIFLGSKITADGDCSHEIKRGLLLGRKATTNLDSILKSINITLQTKVHVVKVTIFAVIIYECKSWAIKKPECQGIDAFELWCWRRLLRVPWTVRRSNQSILKEISLSVHWMNWCWSWNCNTLATWCEELTHLKRPWCSERLNVGGEGDNRRWDGWMISSTQGTKVWVTPGVGDGLAYYRPGILLSMGSQRVGHDWVTELNWYQ